MVVPVNGKDPLKMNSYQGITRTEIAGGKGVEVALTGDARDGVSSGGPSSCEPDCILQVTVMCGYYFHHARGYSQMSRKLCYYVFL